MNGFDDFIPSKWFEGILAVAASVRKVGSSTAKKTVAAVSVAVAATLVTTTVAHASNVAHVPVNFHLSQMEPAVAQLEQLRATETAFISKLRDRTLSAADFDPSVLRFAMEAVKVIGNR